MWSLLYQRHLPSNTPDQREAVPISPTSPSARVVSVWKVLPMKNAKGTIWTDFLDTMGSNQHLENTPHTVRNVALHLLGLCTSHTLECHTREEYLCLPIVFSRVFSNNLTRWLRVWADHMPSWTQSRGWIHHRNQQWGFEPHGICGLQGWGSTAVLSITEPQYKPRT